MFTKTDKALLDRTARRITLSANAIQATHPVWGATEDSKKAKLEYDRLQRDARDLRQMAKRLVPSKPKNVQQAELLTAAGGA